jgi:hypothetical protein
MALIRLNEMTSKLNGSLISRGKSIVPPVFSHPHLFALPVSVLWVGFRV